MGSRSGNGPVSGVVVPSRLTPVVSSTRGCSCASYSVPTLKIFCRYTLIESGPAVPPEYGMLVWWWRVVNPFSASVRVPAERDCVPMRRSPPVRSRSSWMELRPVYSMLW